MEFNAQLLGIPESVFNQFKDSLLVNWSTRQAGIVRDKSIVTKNGVRTVTDRIYIKEKEPKVYADLKGLGLNLVCDVLTDMQLIEDTDEYFVFYIPGWTSENHLGNAGSIKEVKESIVLIEKAVDGEIWIQNIKASQNWDEVKKDQVTGIWSDVKDWEDPELLTLPFIPKDFVSRTITSRNSRTGQLVTVKLTVPTDADLVKAKKLTQEELNELLQVKRVFKNDSNPNTIKHIFVALEREDDVVRSEMFFNGLTKEEKPLNTYTKPPVLIHFPNMKHSFSWILYNEQPLIDNPTEAQIISGVNNMGQVVKLTYPNQYPNVDPKAKAIRVVADPNPRYDAATHTLYYNPDKEAILAFTFNEYNAMGMFSNGKEERFEYYLNLNNGKGSPNFFAVK
jgi:hypothetical protein